MAVPYPSVAVPSLVVEAVAADAELHPLRPASGRTRRYAAVQPVPPFPSSAQPRLDLLAPQHPLDSHCAVYALVAVPRPTTVWDCRSTAHLPLDNEDAGISCLARTLGPLEGNLVINYRSFSLLLAIILPLIHLPVARSPGLCKLCGIVERAPGVFTRRNSNGAFAPIASSNCSG